MPAILAALGIGGTAGAAGAGAAGAGAGAGAAPGLGGMSLLGGGAMTAAPTAAAPGGVGPGSQLFTGTGAATGAPAATAAPPPSGDLSAWDLLAAGQAGGGYQPPKMAPMNLSMSQAQMSPLTLRLIQQFMQQARGGQGGFEWPTQ